jgi:hypothetical protein
MILLNVVSTFALDSGYSNSTGLWDGYSPYVNADGMHVVSPVRIKPILMQLFRFIFESKLTIFFFQFFPSYF